MLNYSSFILTGRWRFVQRITVLVNLQHQRNSLFQEQMFIKAVMLHVICVLPCNTLQQTWQQLLSELTHFMINFQGTIFHLFSSVNRNCDKTQPHISLSSLLSLHVKDTNSHKSQENCTQLVKSKLYFHSIMSTWNLSHLATRHTVREHKINKLIGCNKPIVTCWRCWWAGTVKGWSPPYLASGMCEWW